jgi:hypothetical protein
MWVHYKRSSAGYWGENGTKDGTKDAGKSYLFEEMLVAGENGRVPLTTELCFVYGLIAV